MAGMFGSGAPSGGSGFSVPNVAWPGTDAVTSPVSGTVAASVLPTMDTSGSPGTGVGRDAPQRIAAALPRVSATPGPDAGSTPQPQQQTAPMPERNTAFHPTAQERGIALNIKGPADWTEADWRNFDLYNQQRKE